MTTAQKETTKPVKKPLIQRLLDRLDNYLTRKVEAADAEDHARRERGA